jgi:hypothetical protein
MMIGDVARLEHMKNAYKIPDRKSSLGRPREGWEDNIKINSKK